MFRLVSSSLSITKVKHSISPHRCFCGLAWNNINLWLHLRAPEDPDIMFPKAPCPFTAANSDAACVCVYFPGRRSYWSNVQLNVETITSSDPEMLVAVENVFLINTCVWGLNERHFAVCTMSVNQLVFWWFSADLWSQIWPIIFNINIIH